MADPSGSGAGGDLKPRVEVRLEFGGQIDCPHCGAAIAGNDREDEHGVCDHLALIHLAKFSDAGEPEYCNGRVIQEWWQEQDFEALGQELDDDPESIPAYGQARLDPGIVRMIQAYEECPHIDVLIAQEDQGYGPSDGAIGPVFFGFRRAPAN